MLRPFAWRPAVVVAAVVATVLTVFSARYGFHRDELYFVVAGQHPAAGYVDQPPLTPLIARLSIAVFGETPAGLRVPATLATVATILVVTLIAREFGGGRAAQVLAAACTAVATYVVVVGHMLSTATFDLLLWSVACLFVLRVLRTGDGRWWLAVGAAVGVGLLNKYLVLLLVAGLAIAILAAGPRRVLLTWWLPAGIVLALLVASPNLVWQATHGWPQLTVATGISADDGFENRVMFVPEQLIYLSPGFVPVWLAGIVRLFRDRTLRWARPMAVAYLVGCLLTVLLGGKSYYVLPLLVVLLAAGAPPTVDWLRRGRVPLRRALAGFIGVTSLAATAVIALPTLPPSALRDPGLLSANKEAGEQYGWEAFVATVARGWQQVPAPDRDRAVIVTDNYGEAGAIWVYGARHGLPRPYSGHMSFADWRRPPDTATGPVLVVHQATDSDLAPYFTGCRTVAHHEVDVDNEEQGAVVSLCERPRTGWAQLWPRLRHYY